MHDPLAGGSRRVTWAVVGGGLHGVHVAARLVGEGLVTADELRIIDPGERLLARWRQCTSATGMAYLRSPSVHHLDLSPWSLQEFVRAREVPAAIAYAAPYDRPGLELFDAHCDDVIKRYGLADCHVRARVERCAPRKGSVALILDDDSTLQASHVVLALGAGSECLWPAWAPAGNPRVQHIFGADASSELPKAGDSVLVVGGGISACQVALRLAVDGAQVHLVSRHTTRTHQFDSDPGWLGPKYMREFERETDLAARREIIANARHRGSVPPGLEEKLVHARDDGELEWSTAEIVAMRPMEHGLVTTLANGERLLTDRAVLATGFGMRRPGGALVDALALDSGLPTAPCGYPAVDRLLRWHPRVFVTGPLAELELGPASRNISGARRAGDRIVEAAWAHEQRSGERTRSDDAAAYDGAVFRA